MTLPGPSVISSWIDRSWTVSSWTDTFWTTEIGRVQPVLEEPGTGGPGNVDPRTDGPGSVVISINMQTDQELFYQPSGNETHCKNIVTCVDAKEDIDIGQQVELVNVIYTIIQFQEMFIDH